MFVIMFIVYSLLCYVCYYVYYVIYGIMSIMLFMLLCLLCIVMKNSDLRNDCEINLYLLYRANCKVYYVYR